MGLDPAGPGCGKLGAGDPVQNLNLERMSPEVGHLIRIEELFAGQTGQIAGEEPSNRSEEPIRILLSAADPDMHVRGDPRIAVKGHGMPTDQEVSTPAALRHSRNSRKSGGSRRGSIVQFAKVLQVPPPFLRSAGVPERPLPGIRLGKTPREGNDRLQDAFGHGPSLGFRESKLNRPCAPARPGLGGRSDGWVPALRS